MPTITYPGTYPLVDGATTDAGDVADLVYAPNYATPDSLEVINGHLTEPNLAAGEFIRTRHIQPGSVVRAERVGGSYPSEHYAEMFQEQAGNWLHLDGHTYADDDAQFVPIPGATRDFYLHAEVPALLVTWMLAMVNDSTLTGYPSVVKLFIDDIAFDADRIAMRNCFDPVAPVWNYNYFAAQQNVRGHALLTANNLKSSTMLDPGWHSAGLRVAATARHTHIRSRSFRVLAFP